MFCFPDDVSDHPSSIIRLDRSKIDAQQALEAAHEEEMKMRKEFGKHDIVEKQVARWLGIEETNDATKKKPTKRPSLKLKDKKSPQQSSQELRGRFAFTIVENDVLHELGCDSINSMNIWISACKNYHFWFEDYDFNKIN